MAEPKTVSVPSWLRELAAQHAVEVADSDAGEADALREFARRLKARYEISAWGRMAEALKESTLGGGVDVAFGDSAERELARVVVPTDCARNWRVTWGVQMAQLAGRIGLTRAVLRWGTAAVQHACEVDWGFGASVQLSGSFVSISVRPQVALAGAPIRVIASIAPGEFTRNLHLPLTQSLGLILGSSSSAIMPLPAHAVAFNVYAPFAGSASTEGLDDAGARKWGVPVPGAGGAGQDMSTKPPVTIPAGTAAVRVINASAGAMNPESQLVWFIQP